MKRFVFTTTILMSLFLSMSHAQERIAYDATYQFDNSKCVRFQIYPSGVGNIYWYEGNQCIHKMEFTKIQIITDSTLPNLRYDTLYFQVGSEYLDYVGTNELYVALTVDDSIALIHGIGKTLSGVVPKKFSTQNPSKVKANKKKFDQLHSLL